MLEWGNEKGEEIPRKRLCHIGFPSSCSALPSKGSSSRASCSSWCETFSGTPVAEAIIFLGLLDVLL